MAKAKVSWGILSTAKIGTQKVIPAMQLGRRTNIVAIASRSPERSKEAAKGLGIPVALGSYEELLARKDIDAVYIPLPNHLHVEWSIKALKAGKHVLCEKPIAMNASEAARLLRESKKFPALKIMEAFMYKHHPQTLAARDLVTKGVIGELRNVNAHFSYFNVNPEDIRNKADIGGGGLLDIGCYCISISRYLFDAEPVRVFGTVEYDRVMKVDRLVTGLLEFPKGSATVTCSTQMANFQFTKAFGTKGSIELEPSFTPMPDRPALLVYAVAGERKELKFDPCDHYTLQGDAFSEAILENHPVPTSLEDAVANMRVIDAIFESGKTGRWITIGKRGKR